ncbi:MAG: hypothetical protein ABIH92_05005 [Nanoarchaeota archaeon]
MSSINCGRADGTPTIRQNKKGAAEAIATFALLAVTIAAVLFASWNVMNVLAMKSDIQTSPAMICLNEQTAPQGPSLEIDNACINLEGDIKVTVQRSLKDIRINSLTFEFKDFIFKCGDSCADCTLPEPGETKTYFFTLDNPQDQEKVTLYANECELDSRNILESCE